MKHRPTRWTHTFKAVVRRAWGNRAKINQATFGAFSGITAKISSNERYS